MSRDYCFTVFEKECPSMTVLKADTIKYLIVGREVCPETGRKHLQCYANFTRTYAIPGAQKLLGIGKSHMEKKRGSREEARDYCKKEGDWYEAGTFEALTKEDLFKQPIEYLKDKHPEFYCRYHKGLEKLQPKGPIERDIVIHILWGEPGCGKTGKVMRMGNVFKFDPPYKWFDGYEGEDILLIDDYKRDAIERGLLLNMLDRWRMKLDIKGSYTWALWTKIYITSNFSPDIWLTDAIRSRLDRFAGSDIVCMTHDGATGNTVP